MESSSWQQNTCKNTGFWFSLNHYDCKNTGFCLGRLPEPCVFCMRSCCQDQDSIQASSWQQENMKKNRVLAKARCRTRVFTVIMARIKPKPCVFTLLFERMKPEPFVFAYILGPCPLQSVIGLHLDFHKP